MSTARMRRVPAALACILGAAVPGCANVFGIDRLSPLADEGGSPEEAGPPHDSGSSPETDAGEAGPTVETLAMNQASPSGIAIDGSNLFWANQGGGQIMRFTLPGGASPQMAVTGESSPSAVVTVGGNVFWIASNGLRGAVPFGAVVPLVAASGLSPYLATDGTNVYFENGGNVLACPATPQACTPVSVFPAPLATPMGMAVGNGRAYLVAAGSLMACGTSGCASPTTIIPQVTGPTVVGVGPVTAYVANSSGQIASCPAAGGCGSAEVTVAGQANIGAILVDGPYLYWMESTPGGSVKRCMPGSCLAQFDILAHAANPSAMVTDAKYLYFTATQAGTVSRVRK